MTTDLTCPKCQFEFEAKEWEEGRCPNCENKYQWDEFCAEDYSDCWVEAIWESIYKDLPNSYYKW